MKSKFYLTARVILFLFFANCSLQGQEELKEADSIDSILNKGINGKYYLITSTTLHSYAQGLSLSLLFNEPIREIPGGFESSTKRTPFGRAFPYIVGAAGLTTSILATRNKWISPAAANVHFWGSLTGYYHGMSLYMAINDDSELNIADGFPYYVGLFSLAEGWAGYLIAKKRNIDYARSMAWNSGNLWGIAAGYLLYNSHSESESPKYTGISMLGGSALGILGTNALQNLYPRSSGDWRAINAGGLVGSMFGLSLVDAVDSYKRIHIYILFSSALGFTGAHMLTRNTSLTKFEGAKIGIGTGAGAFLGAMLGYMVEAEVLPGMLLIGSTAALGWGITYAAIRSKGSKKTKGLGLEKDRSGNFNFHVNPTGFSMLKMNEAQQIRLMQQNIPTGMAGLTLTW